MKAEPPEKGGCRLNSRPHIEFSKNKQFIGRALASVLTGSNPTHENPYRNRV